MGEMKVQRMQITLNGAPIAPDADPKTPLLYLLRQRCDALGVRFGCGAGQCGACTVIIDGVAQQSCLVTNAQAQGTQILTPEGLAADPVGALVLQAFLDEQAAQCGYCINGVMMSLTALLTRRPAPTADELTTCLDRHLCRCGTHLRIVRAARRAIAALAGADPR